MKYIILHGTGTTSKEITAKLLDKGKCCKFIQPKTSSEKHAKMWGIPWTKRATLEHLITSTDEVLFSTMVNYELFVYLKSMMDETLWNVLILPESEVRFFPTYDNERVYVEFAKDIYILESDDGEITSYSYEEPIVETIKEYIKCNQ